MEGAVPDVAFQSESGLSYKSFASELMARVSESLKLETHGTRVGSQASEGVSALQTKIDTDANSHTGRQVLNMRFALGADDTAYLNSAIAMLFTGTEMDNRQLDLSGLSPPDVQKHIRKAVIAQLQSERRKRRKDAVRVVTALTDQVVSYLSIKSVRQMLRNAMDVLFPAMASNAAVGSRNKDWHVVNVLLQDDSWSEAKAKQEFKNGAGGKGVYFVLLLLEAALDKDGSIGTAISAVIADMVGYDEDDAYIDAADAADHGGGGGLESQYSRLDTRFDKNNVWGQEDDNRTRAMLEMVDERRHRALLHDLGPMGSYTQYCIRRGLVGLKGPLHSDVSKGVGSEPGVGSTTEDFWIVEQELTYYLPRAPMLGISNIYDPTTPQNDIAKTYRLGRRQFKSIVHFAPLAEMEAYAQEAVDNLKGDYAVVPMNPFCKDLEARLAIRWKPVGDIGEKIAKAAAMQHAASRCEKISQDMKDEIDGTMHVIYALMAAGFELRRLAPHAAVVDHKRKNNDSSVQHSRLVANPEDTENPIWSSEAPYLCTTPHSIWGARRFAVPYESGYASILSGGISDAPDRDTYLVNDMATTVDPQTFSTWEDRMVFKPHPWRPGTTWGRTSDILKNRLQSEAVQPDEQPKLPDLFLGPDADYGYSFPIFEFRSELLRNVTDVDHTNLLPVGNVDHNLKQLRRPHMHAIVRYALLHAHALHEEVCRDEIGDTTAQATLLAASTVHKDDRAGIWNDMLREVAISNDRLYTFIRTLSGAMGEDASVLLSSVDETAQRAARALETERKEIAKRVSDFQAKIVEIIIGGIVKTSHLEMRPDGSDGEFQVVDSEMAKELRALASGESGRPFFEANVAVQGMISQARTDKTSLGAVVRGLGGVVSTLYDQLQTELLTATGVGSGGLAMMAQPRNSFMVHLRDDATAAIRVAFDRFSREFRGRQIRLYELIEGCDPHLSLRFAEFVAHVLIQVRSSSGSTALYVSEGTRQQTALQARASLLRLTNRAAEYVRFAPAPSFQKDLSAGGIQAARMAYFANHVSGNGGVGAMRGYIVRVEGRSDIEGGWKGGFHLPYSAGLRYTPYPQPHP
jgi:hypothetical protein